MFKRFFHSINGATGPEAVTGNSASIPVEPTPNAPVPAPAACEPAPFDSFESVYRNAALKTPTIDCSILKVAEMIDSPHLAGMSAEPKRNSILMALEAAGAEIDFLLEDAVFRQRALNDHEEVLLNLLRDFESVRSDNVRNLQAELERVTAQYMARIQTNLDEVAHEQDSLRNWQRRKQQECQRISEAALLCVPGGSQTSTGAFPALLERGAAAASWR